MNILYIEDDEDDQQIFAEAVNLLSPKAILHFAKDGIQAVNFIYDATVELDLIFLDLNMPHMDGLQFLHTLRKSDFKELPVVVFTTSTNPRDRADCQKLGIKDYISKPNTYNDFTVLLRKYLSNES